MATGDVTLFEEFIGELGTKVHNLDADTIRIGIITSSSTPTASDATPRWGDYSANQVATGGTYADKGPDISATYSEAAGVGTLDATDVTISQDGSGFTNGRWGIIYNDTATNDEAIAFVDLGADRSIVSGDLVITWNASGIATWTIT